MDPCADPITSRILKLHQKLLNNIFYWNPERNFTFHSQRVPPGPKYVFWVGIVRVGIVRVGIVLVGIVRVEIVRTPLKPMRNQLGNEISKIALL